MNASSRRGATLLALCLVASACGGPELEQEVGQELGKASSAAASTCGLLKTGEYLLRGESVQSCNGRATLVHQGNDGNVVLYENGVGALWSTGTGGRNTNHFVMQGDGNLVLYKPSLNWLWQSYTNGNPGAFLAIQDDCNLVVYSTTMQVLWSSYTVCRVADLRPTAITYPQGAITAGVPVRFDSGIRNAGGADAPGLFSIRWYVDGVSHGYGGHVTVPAQTTMMDGNSFYTWVSPVAGWHTITFAVDTDGHVPELNESNNSRSIQVYVYPAP